MRTTTYLEMTSLDQLIPAACHNADWQLRQSRVACGEWGRFLYGAVGQAYRWIDRKHWTNEQWRAHFERPEIELWVGFCSDTPCGYCELERQSNSDGRHCQFIAYFGLLPQFIGRGIGGWMLEAATRQAWRSNPSRVWLHTCNLDHPHALANYQKRGFEVSKVES